ncbi:MAG TPA: hypothetical protein PK006_04275 [Saprospiraceae bacterium]|nr:hypothetical protein [Saprospiraceae bacterium]
MLDLMFDQSEIQGDAQSLKLIGVSISQKTGQKFDYVKFRQAIYSLKKMAMDENTSIQSTLATAKTMGVQTSDIIQSAGQFGELLTEEEKKFNEALQKQTNEKVQSKKQELESIHSQIQQLKESIEKIQKQVSELEKSAPALELEINSNEKLIESKKENFNNTIHNLKQLIQNDILLLQKF